MMIASVKSGEDQGLSDRDRGTRRRRADLRFSKIDLKDVDDSLNYSKGRDER